ncbi:neurofibromin-like [Watersipora subatra]|uniref:neurofibromin-like n=1 Tax=Watersipora subatra TaxID=2589382 RepID=UPI00355BE2BA
MAIVGSSNKVCKQAHIKLEVVLFMYLWSIDIESVLTAMSCFEFLCEEADILYGGDEQVINLHLPNYAIYQEIASAHKDLTTGRAALQKRIMPMLRKIEKPTPGNEQAWTTTFTKIWKKNTDFLQNYPHKVDGGMTVKKRTSNQTSDHELEDQLHEWVNMTGFLCALGSVCLTKSDRSADTVYCPVTDFIGHLLKLLVCSNEKFGPQIQKHVKELVANELSPAIYPILFEQIKLDVDKFFEEVNGQVRVTEINTQYIENIIFIMKMIMEQYKSEQGGEHLGQATIEPLMLAIVRYVRYLSDEPDDIKKKTKLCNLVQVMMSRRDDLTFRQEMKFRNKLVDYLTEWIMGNNMAHNSSHLSKTADRPVSTSRALDLASMEAVAALLKALPLQPEESDRGDLMEAKSNLFQKYFTLFMKLLNECSDELEGGKEKGQLTSLRNVTVQAMSNLLSANIDTGLMHSISLGYHKDAQTRAAFMEVLTKILQQGTEFETLAETALADRYDRLVELVTMIGDKGELPIAMALANVVDNQHLDELARVLVTLFDAKHLLYQLLGNMFNREVEGDCMQTLFRGNGLSSKIMSFCFKLYGQQYLRDLFTPHLERMFEEDAKGICYEVDPRRLDGHSGDLQSILSTNRKNLLILTQSIFDAIVKSADSFPAQLKNMLFYLSQVVNSRFPDESIFAVGTVVFLRFINPALVSAHDCGLCSREPTLNMKRGITLVCKIMQNIANRVETEKETYMRYFSDFFRTNLDAGHRFFREIATEVDDSETTGQIQCYFSDSTSVALHRLLWIYEEKIGEFLASSRDQKAAGRRPFDKMATLLAYLGPPEHRPSDSEWSAMYMDMSSTKFEELMSKQNMHEKDEYKSLKSLMIFYQNGMSRNGHPVFYYIARRFKLMEINGDLLIYHVLLTLKPYFHKPFELVIDFTHTNAENRFKAHFLSHWFYVMPDTAYKNLCQVYIYNCSSWVKVYTKFHDRQFFTLKNNPKLIFIDQRCQLNAYIEPEQQKLPGSTLSLEEDQKVFSSGLSITIKDTKCSIKIGQSAIQISSNEKSKVLGHQVLLNDVYYVAEIKEVSLVDDNQFTISISSESGPLSFIHADSESIVAALNHIKHRYQLTQPESYTPHTKIKPKDVPGTLLNVALLNLGSSDPSLRSAAYNLLCVLTQTFDLQIEDQLLLTTGLCIPSNNTLFIKHISEKLAANVTRLTLEFLEECIQGCRNSSIEMKHLCLEYMTPWLPNLTKFCKHQDEHKRQKVMLILDKLITLTIEEVKMYPSVQAKIWGTIGQVGDLIDMVLDSFIKRSVTGGFGSKPADIMADTSVALASANVELVSRKVVSRILHMIEKTCMSPTLTLESHLMWNDIAILARYLLMLSFNNSLHVAAHLPFLFHIVTLLVGLGPVSMKASTHGLVINIIHSLCTCSQLNFNDDTFRQLKLNLTEFSLNKFYNLFGISKVKSAAVSAFRTSYRSNDRSFTSISPDDESVPLTSLEVITDALLEIMEAASTTVKGKCNWLQQWMDLAKRFAFQYNPALQPRAIVVYGCISKTISEAEVKQLLRILRKALESEGILIEGVVMCLTRVQPLLKQDSVIHKFLFWVAIAILQLEDQRLYSAALAMLEQNLLTLDTHGVFETQSLRDCMMSTRQQLNFHFRMIDHTLELNFDYNFHFALIAHLIKGFRHPESTTVSRTMRVINTCLCIVSKNLPDKFAVTPETIPYLTALLSVSEEVRSRCQLSPVDSPPSYSEVFSTPSHFMHDLSLSGDASTGLRSLPGTAKQWKSLDEAANRNTHAVVTGRSASYNVSPASSRPTVLEVAPPRPPPPRGERSSRTSASAESNILLDPESLDDELVSLVLTVMATLVGFTTDDSEKRVLYQYLAEASIKFPKVFPVVYNLLEPKVIEHLRYSHDQVMLSSVQTIMQNMLTIDMEQQQKQYLLLQNAGFGGISRFAGPFRQSNFNGAENLAICLEDMVDNYLPGDDRDFDVNNPYPRSLGISASLSLSSLGSPTGSVPDSSTYRSRHGSQQSRRVLEQL